MKTSQANRHRISTVLAVRYSRGVKEESEERQKGLVRMSGLRCAEPAALAGLLANEIQLMQSRSATLPFL